MHRAILLAILIVGLFVPAAAFAQGNSSLDQYTEEVPSAGGGEAPGDNAGSTGVLPASGGGDGGGGGGSESAPAASTGNQSTAASPTNPVEAAAASLAQSTAPASRANGDRADSAPASAGSGDSGSGQAAAPATLDRDSGSNDGFNLVWPIIFGASLLLAIAWAVGRHLHQRAQDGIGSPA